MDARSLRYFSMVAQEGSFSRAADRLHVAQPALSQQIKKLEGDLGAQLLRRTGRGAVPTDAGLKLLAHALEILQRIDAAREELRGEAAEPIGRVTVGMSQSMAMILTAPLVRTVTADWPKVSLHVMECGTGYIPGWLRTGQLDLGLTFRAGSAAHVDFEPLAHEDLLLIGAPNAFAGNARKNRKRTMAEVPLKALGTYPLVLPARLHSLRELIDHSAERAGVELNVIAEVDAMPQLKDLAMQGIAYSILSYSAVRQELSEGRLAAARIVRPSIARSVYLCRLAGAPQSIAARKVGNLIRDIVRSQVEEGHWPARLLSGRP